jgi:hypothetical protein
MSEAEFFWCLAEPPRAKQIEVAHPGLFSIHMERAFAPRGFPLTLTEADIGILHGMAATWQEPGVSPYVLMAINIRKYKKIVVYMKQAETVVGNCVRCGQQLERNGQCYCGARPIEPPEAE